MFEIEWSAGHYFRTGFSLLLLLLFVEVGLRDEIVSARDEVGMTGEADLLRDGTTGSVVVDVGRLWIVIEWSLFSIRILEWTYRSMLVDVSFLAGGRISRIVEALEIWFESCRSLPLLDTLIVRPVVVGDVSLPSIFADAVDVTWVFGEGSNGPCGTGLTLIVLLVGEAVLLPFAVSILTLGFDRSTRIYIENKSQLGRTPMAIWTSYQYSVLSPIDWTSWQCSGRRMLIERMEKVTLLWVPLTHHYPD